MIRRILQFFGRQRWLRFGLRDRIIRTFHSPDVPAKESFEVPFFGGEYKGYFSNFIDWSVFYYGAYAVEELDFIRDAAKIQDDQLMIDVGANVGHHSLFMALHADRVHAFEPFEAVRKQIHEKRKINSLPNLEIYEVGLSEKDEELKYQPPTTSNTGTGSFVNNGNETNTVMLSVRNGDDFLTVAGIRQVHFIKIDTEGFEVPVLKGLNQTIERDRPILFVEWGFQSKLQFSQFLPEDYLLFDFLPDRNLFIFFGKPGYRLKIPSSDQSGNKVALPKEKMDYFKKRVIGSPH